jgi:hypothetical protein
LISCDFARLLLHRVDLFKNNSYFLFIRIHFFVLKKWKRNEKKTQRKKMKKNPKNENGNERKTRSRWMTASMAASSAGRPSMRYMRTIAALAWSKRPCWTSLY